MRRLISSAVLGLTLPAVVVLAPVIDTSSGNGPVSPDIQVVPLSNLHRAKADAPSGTSLLSDELSTRAFRLAGVSWDAAGGSDLTVQVRVREDNGWTDWHDLEVGDAAPNAGTADSEPGRAATEPLATDLARGVQVAIGAPHGLPEDLKLVLIDPKPRAADSRLGETGAGAAQASIDRPAIITRQQWGADEKLRQKACPSGPSYVSTIKMAFVHHTDGPNNYEAKDSAALVRGMYAYHVEANGWCDIGYNFLVDKYGQIFEGRYGGIDRPVLGAHTAGFNTDSFGVSMMGTYMTEQPSAELLLSLQRVIAWKFSLYGIDPFGKATLTASNATGVRYPSGTKVTFNTISGHRDGVYTDCPGDMGYQMLPDIRRGVAAVDANRQFVQALYTDFLGRTADPDGLSYYAKMIDAKPAVRGDVVRYIGTGTEAYGLRVDDLYQTMLERTSDPSGREYWVNQLRSGRILPYGVAATFLGSEETFASAGKDVTAWTALAYRRALGREPDSGGLEYWSKQVAKIGRYAVAANLYNSQENKERRVGKIYQQLLGRDPDPSGLQYALQIISTHGDVSLSTITAASPEYFQRATTRSFYP